MKVKAKHQQHFNGNEIFIQWAPQYTQHKISQLEDTLTETSLNKIQRNNTEINKTRHQRTQR